MVIYIWYTSIRIGVVISLGSLQWFFYISPSLSFYFFLIILITQQDLKIRLANSFNWDFFKNGKRIVYNKRHIHPCMSFRSVMVYFYSSLPKGWIHTCIHAYVGTLWFYSWKHAVSINMVERTKIINKRTKDFVNSVIYSFVTLCILSIGWTIYIIFRNPFFRDVNESNVYYTMFIFVMIFFKL